MRTFVTGAAGFIGSTLVDRLLGDGDHIVGIDDLVSGRIANLDARRSDGFTFIGDSVTSSALADLVATAAPEATFHLAAQVDVRKSVDDPFHDARTNVLGMINIVEASRRAGVQRIVFAASGGSRYGEPTELPVGEDVPPTPTTAELHQLMSEAIGIPSRPLYKDARTGEIQAIALDYAAASAALGWQPKVDVAEGVRRTVSWLRDTLNVSPPAPVAV